MEFTEEAFGGIPVLQLRGALDASRTFRELQDRVRVYLTGGGRNLVIDLKNVRNLDTAGLTRLLAVLSHSGPASGIVRLASVGCNDLPIPDTLLLEFQVFERPTSASPRDHLAGVTAGTAA